MVDLIPILWTKINTIPYHTIFNCGYLPASKSVVSRSRKSLCMDMRRRYLQRGSFSPMGYLIKRLQHGRAIARREGPRTNISWSLDGQTLCVAGSRITMYESHQTIHFTLAQIEHTTRQLIFDWWSKVDPSTIMYDIPKHTQGYSLLQKPSNELQSSFKHFIRRAFSKEGGDFALRGEGRKCAMSYTKQCERLVRLLFSGIHVCSGMLAREEELCVIRWADTAAVQRNIFIYQSQIMLIFSYKQVGRGTIRFILFELRGHYPSIWPKLGPSAISSVVT
jgi:hypothetical protein